MEINATTLVYFRESSRRRKEKGMTMSLICGQLGVVRDCSVMDTDMNAVTQKCLSVK